MRTSWPRARRVAALAVPALVSLSLGAVAAAAPASAGRAPASRPAGARVTWHALALKNGWKSSQQVDSTGNPEWAVKGQVVYLAGSLHQASGTNTEFAVLPPAARPARTLYITNYTLDGNWGHLYAKPNGQLFAFGTDATSFFSLAGISFPARSMRQRPLALRNGWNSSQFRWNTGDPSYAVRNGVVYLSGSVHQRANASDVFTVLPRAARPSHNLLIVVDTFDATTGIVYISAHGPVEAYSGSARAFTSLAGISFPARSTAPHRLTLLDGWLSRQSLNGTGDPSYAVRGGVVYLSGSLWSGSSEQFAQLPPAVRPRHWLYFKIYANGGAVGSLDITPLGEVDLFGSGTTAFSSLATISYPLGS